MSFNAKEAAQRLFDIADAIEKQAAEKTLFVCEGCNHTASLGSINTERAKFASDNGISNVSGISVENTITCKACGGDMKYAATEESEKFFVEAADVLIEDTEEVTDEEPAEEEAPAEEDAPIEVTDEDVDETEAPADEEEEKEEKAEDKPKKRSTKDKEDSDGKVELKEEPEAQFGDNDKKTRSKKAFDAAVERYSM